MDGGVAAGDVFQALQVAVSSGTLANVADSQVDAASLSRTDVSSNSMDSATVNIAVLLAFIMGVLTP